MEFSTLENAHIAYSFILMITYGELLFLGTGGSMGIPMVGCHCPVCSSSSPFNKRLRPSAMVHVNQRKIVMDAGPDYRAQALRYQLDDIDGVIFTHAHHDHTAGIDELRVHFLRRKQPLPCLLSSSTAEELMRRYPYIFVKENKTLVSRLDLQRLPNDRGEVLFQGLHINYVSYEQSGMQVNGFRFGNLAYITDIKHFPETIYTDLEGIDTLVISALRYEANFLHFSVEEAVVFAEKVGARQVWLTHVAHDLDHALANASLPSHVQLAYDGLMINFEVDSAD